MSEGTQRFLDAAQRRGDPDRSVEPALEAIRLLEKSLADLGEAYSSQSIAFRKQREPQIGMLLAGTVIPPTPTSSNHSDEFCDAFNSAAIRLSWADIETDSGRFHYDDAEHAIRFCASKGMRVIGGPLIDFRERLMPHWLYLLEDNFDSFLTAALQFVERTVLKFRGSVQLWNCASGLNTPGPIDLDDEQLMRLAVGILQVVRRNDPNTPTIITFDQPYGEYLAHHRDGISPLHFADALVRSGLGMAGLGVEVRTNYASDATLPRSAVDFGLMIDRWATLGMPLLVQLTVPGGSGADDQAVIPADVMFLDPSEDLANEQLRVAGPLIRTLLAKHIVHGIVWGGWSDVDPHVMSHSGMIDGSGNARPLLDYVTRLRREFLS